MKTGDGRRETGDVPPDGLPTTACAGSDSPTGCLPSAVSCLPAYTRREFLAALIAAPAAPALIGLARKSGPAITGGFVDDNSALGHALRDGTLSTRAREQRRVSVAIVGGGMGGLSAGWRLDGLGMRDWLLLELADTPGGNARSGRNDAGRYPWGAHYLPVPGPQATLVRQLMRELGVLDANGEWDERTLCHSPQERLFQHGRWHEGLEPLDALSADERAQFARLAETIAEWRASGVFSVPTALGHERLASGRVPRAVADRARALDAQTADAWLREQGFTSPALRWWVEYGMRDDYGASLTQASAWAAVHYSAAREPDEQGPLTWPEGNDWIARQLAARAGERIVTRAPAVQLERKGTQWVVHTPLVDVTCDAVIWAAPLLVLPKVLPSVTLPVTTDYAPWVVANLTLKRPPAEQGAPPAWDNVIYGSPSLGYVDAGHQSLATRPDGRVWTWYHAVVDRPSADGRKWMQDRSWSAWRDQILSDLSRAHADITECVAHIDIMRWGHAMARPVPGLMARVERLRRWAPAPQLVVAHADLSSLSLFEEAQWHGVEAADRVVGMLGSARGRLPRD
ncbi:MAG: NAD(P)-binding protein [Gemmatimonadaceae bacterium]|nr:NAD(P)-binding protein [Gemmatimonadaceae bacterium]